MKSVVKLLGFIAILVVIGVFFGCEGELEQIHGSGLPILTGTVSIEGTAQSGKILTADTSAVGGNGIITFQWKRDNNIPIGFDDSTYMILDDDIGSIITVTVTRSENSGSITSYPTDEIIPSDLPALTGTVNIIGIAEVGEMLTADVSDLEGDGWIEYYWKRGEHTIGYDNTYTIQEDDIGSIITVTVTRSENSGSVTSEPTDIVRTPGLAFTLINNGMAYSVSKGTAKGELIVIPALNNGLPVIEIADSGFVQYTDLTSVIIPTGVSRIGNYAFFHCSNLTSVVIPEGIANIGNFAFSDCSSLTTVYFGGSDNSEWSAILIGSNNTQLVNANRYYYSETNPETDGSFWRFANGVPIGATYYSVTFNNDGGSIIATQMISHGNSVNRPTNPTRNGYVFIGWFNNSEFTLLYNFNTSVTSNIVLYAKWWDTNTEMVQIPAGTLAWSYYTITISGFKMSKYEVTQELYESVMGLNPSDFKFNPAAGEVQGMRPVECVTWFDAIEFCNKLSMTEGLTPVYSIYGRNPATGYPITSATVSVNWEANGYRLPTEAQWEYACRAGSTIIWYFGDNESELVNYAWYGVNSNSITHQVGLKLPNAFGLYDMYGNVIEWCWDWYGSYPTSNLNNYTGAFSGSSRVNRGGSFTLLALYMSSYERNSNNPSSRYASMGFRLVRP